MVLSPIYSQRLIKGKEIHKRTTGWCGLHPQTKRPRSGTAIYAFPSSPAISATPRENSPERKLITGQVEVVE